MKKLKEVTDKKKTSLLKTIDEKLTEAARELGFSLEQRTVRMKQRDKKVWILPVGLFAVSGLGGGGGGFLLSCISSPPLLRRAAPASHRAGSRVVRGLDWKSPAGVVGTRQGTLAVVAELRPGQPGLSLVLTYQSLIS